MRLAVIDIDGTLLNSRGELTERTVDAIKSLKKKKIYVTFATGRLPASVKKYEYLANAPLVCLNGAIVPEMDHKINIPNDVLREIFCAQSKAHAFVFKDDHIYCEDSERARELSEKWGEGVTVFLERSELEQIKDVQMIMFLDGDSGKFAHIPGISVVQSEKDHVDIMAKGVNKKHALKKLIDAGYDIVFAVGDAHNDVGMFELADISVAMGNAPQEVKEHADCVTLSNDNDGVAIALNIFKDSLK